MTRGSASETEAPPRAPSRRRRSFATAAVGVVLGPLLLFTPGGCDRPAPEAGPGPDADAASRGAATAASIVRAPIAASLPPHAVPPLTAREKVGQSIFLDAALSDPPGTSCASCHDPAAAYAGNNGSDTGVARGSRPGHFARRNAPSVLYLKYVPPFHFALEDDDDINESPFGGLTWSGRADTVAEFVRLPLFDPDEMNNAGEEAIARKLRASPYAADMAREFPGALETPASAVKAVGEAVQSFLTSETMSPFTSKFDDYLRGTAQLSPLETKGLTIFESRAKGACNHCHPMYPHSNRPESSLFTTYAYDAVGAPRNPSVAANADPRRYDLGLCERTPKKEPSSDPKWCGSFRVPSLRNVATRQRFMHNGTFSKLREVVAFYATRSTKPDLWYPHGTKFDDLPERYRGNVNTLSFPYNRREGAPPAFDDAEVDAVVAFLETLTDAAYRRPDRSPRAESGSP